MASRAGSQKTMRLAATLLTLASVFFVLWFIAGSDVARFLDFRAFYCGAVVASAHADPYRAEPVGSCERNPIPNKPLDKSGVVIPAPLPGWVILLLEPLARLPFISAAIIWCSLLIGAFVALQLQVARCFPSLNAVAAFVFLLPLGFWIPMLPGQPTPICVVLLLAAALLLRGGNDRAAAIIAAAATMEPHIALPVCVALFVTRPKTRVPLILSAVALAALSVAALGVSENLEYVLRVLPAQIVAESNFNDQFSATSLLMAAGVSRGAAIVAGQVSYWLLVIVSVWLARSYAAARRDSALIVFVPMAFSVLGGPYVHVEHLLAAVPLAMYVVSRRSATGRPLALGAAIAVAWPLRSMLILTGAIPGTVVILPPASPDGPTLLAETPWSAAIAGLRTSSIDVLTKVPSWAGLIALVAIAAAIARPGGLTGPSSPWLQGQSDNSLEGRTMDKARVRVVIFAIALILIVGVTVYEASAILGALTRVHH